MNLNIILFLVTTVTIKTMILIDFNTKSDISGWTIVDDIVMGGQSNGNFDLNQEGNGVFSGKISLENNGGFSSLRYRFNERNVEAYSKAILKIKGSGADFQFRVKSSIDERHSYIATFQTNNTWQTVEVSLKDMFPAFRGNTLNIPNYPTKVMEEITFLIANKKAESFQLEIDSIVLE